MGSTRSFPALGFDPAPGDLAAVHSAIDALNSSGKKVTEAQDSASGVSTGNTWTGQAAESFQQQIKTLSTNVGTAGTTIGAARKVLDQWATELGTMQSRADQLEQDAAKAQQQVRTAQANPDLKMAGQTFTDAQSARTAQQKYQAATSQVKAAQGKLDEVRKQGKQLLQQHQQTAKSTASALNGKSTAQSTSPRHDQPTQSGQSKGQKTVNAARSQKGVPYAWGANKSVNGPSKGVRNTPGDGDPNKDADKHGDYNKTGFDCGGLVRYSVYQGTGEDVGGGTWNQMKYFQSHNQSISTDASQLQPGDVVYLRGGDHVAIYEGNGMVVEAPESGDVVKETPLSKEGPIYYAARPK